MAEEVKNNEGEEVEEGKTHGNTGLPFGLCAKYGIVLPRNATPREAWNALKHRGIYPPWTKRAKDNIRPIRTIKQRNMLTKSASRYMID